MPEMTEQTHAFLQHLSHFSSVARLPIGERITLLLDLR